MNKLPILLLVLMAACVPQKKYDALLAENERLMAQLEACEEQLALVSEDASQLEASLDQALGENNDLLAQVADLKEDVEELEVQLAAARARYDAALEGSSEVKQQLLRQQEEVAALKAELEDLRRILQEKEAAIKAIRQKIRQALVAFNDDELTVELRDGKVYVSLAEKLLFGSGSVKVGPEGQEALKRLAEAIRDEEGLSLLVEGHTDDVPIGNTSRYMQDNWDLSVMRATSITRILIEGGVPEKMITAAGRGEWIPKATNDTAEGRTLNRRTEIIIAPDLSELFELGE